jgi:hypothetical protein
MENLIEDFKEFKEGVVNSESPRVYMTKETTIVPLWIKA